MIGVNVAKAEKIIWMVYAEIKAGSDPCATDYEQEAISRTQTFTA